MLALLVLTCVAQGAVPACHAVRLRIYSAARFCEADRRVALSNFARARLLHRRGQWFAVARCTRSEAAATLGPDAFRHIQPPDPQTVAARP